MENTSLTTSLKNVRIYEATKETGENGCHQQQEEHQEEQQHQQHDQQQQLQQQQQQHDQQQQQLQPQQEQQTQLQPQDASSSNLDHTRKKKQWLLKRKKKLSRRQSSEGAFIHITGTGTILEDTVGFSQRNREKNESFSEADEFPRGVGQYENFHTIDWQRDLARSKYRRRYLDRKMNTGFCGLLKGHFDACSGWICVFLVGVAAGSIAAAIDIGEGWLNDLKEGVCPQAFWLNKEQCCWSSNSTFYDGNKCDQWSDWVEFMGKDHSDNAEYAICYTIYVLWSLFFGALASCMVRALAPYACGSGIPEIKTILSGFIMRGYLGKMTLLVKSVTIMLSVASGLVLGKEGPLVHVVCCIGNVLAYLFPKYGKNEAKKREVLSAAAAAGVSVAFNAPIGGVLFSLEEVSYYFPMKTLWRSFFCALVAAFVLRSINPFGTDHPVKYYMNATRAWMLPELLPFLFLGVLGGIIGTAFIWCNTAWCKIRKSTRLGKFPITEVLTVTLVTAMIAYPNEFTRMNTSDLIRILFSECGIHDSSPLCDYKRNVTSLEKHMQVIAMGQGIHKSLYLLLQALVTTWVLTIFTFGMKVPAGLFVPSMAMGAIMGRIIGIGVQQLTITYHNSWFVKSMCTSNDDCLSPGLYAMIGAAATLAGVTRMTVSLVVIMFELTGSVDYIVPLMATLMVSKWVGEALGIEGIYDSHIHLNRYPFLNKKEAFRHSTVARDLTRLVRKDRDEMQCLPREGMTVNDVEDIMKRTSHIGFPVVLSKENPYLFGYVLRRDLNLAIEHLKNTKEEISEESPVYFTEKPPVVRPKLAPILLSRIVDKAPITVTVQTPMDTVIDMFCKLGLRQILVTDNGGLVDIITKKDVLNHMEEMSKPKRTRAAGIEL